MGKQPRMLAPYERKVTVGWPATHQEVVAVGYEDGMVLLVRIEDGGEILARASRATHRSPRWRGT